MSKVISEGEQTKNGRRIKFKLTELDTEEIKLSKRVAEKVFGVNLKNRSYGITYYKDYKYVEISFFDKGNVFGWTERLKEKDYKEIINKL